MWGPPGASPSLLHPSKGRGPQPTSHAWQSTPPLAGDKKRLLPLCFLFKDGWGGGEAIGTNKVWGRLRVPAGAAARRQCGGHYPLCLVPGAVSTSPPSALVSSLLSAPTPKACLGPTLDLGYSRARKLEREPHSPLPAVRRWLHLRARRAAESARTRPTEAVQGITSPRRREAQAPGRCFPSRDA